MKNRFLRWTVRLGALALTAAIIAGVVFWQVILGGGQGQAEDEQEPEGKATVTTVEAAPRTQKPSASTLALSSDRRWCHWRLPCPTRPRCSEPWITTASNELWFVTRPRRKPR